MNLISLSKKDNSLHGEIQLNASKSISNRLLIIKALSSKPFEILNLSSAVDTVCLEGLLNDFNEENTTFDTGAAGTTFRFLTAFFAFQKGKQILTGSERMKQRPIGILVDALTTLGANINYLEKEGFPPLEIGEAFPNEIVELTIPANISSQFISALLLIAPIRPKGLKLILEGEIVSLPYLKMTLNLMNEFGIDFCFKNNIIEVANQNYVAKNYEVESDWSAASYYYAMAALSKDCNISLLGLKENSIQGDSCIQDIMYPLGVTSTFENGKLKLTNNHNEKLDFFKYDFTSCPDLAQTVSVTLACLGISSSLTGLSTLRIKETDRIEALKNELKKVSVKLVSETDSFLQEGKVENKTGSSITFATYEDHRMAMAFACIAILINIQIAEPEVVKKSYPQFWEDLKHLGFQIH